MTPHDLLGRQIEKGQLVIVPDDNHRICLGVVDDVLTATGNVDVRTVRLDRVPEEQVERFPYPANQLLSLGFDVLNHHNPLHKRLLEIMLNES